jgi:hypothetical protein
VLRATRMPAVLVELGFLTHGAERAKMLEGTYRKAMCAAIADGIEAWGGVAKPVPLPESPKPEATPEPKRVETLPTTEEQLMTRPLKLPDRVDVLMDQPVVEVVWAYARQDETLESFQCRLLDATLASPQLTARLPGWMPIPLARMLLRRILRCDGE